MSGHQVHQTGHQPIWLSIGLVVSCIGKTNVPCPRWRLRSWSRETGSTVSSRVSPLILHPNLDHSRVYSPGSTHGLRFPRQRSSKPSTDSGSVPSLLGYSIAYQWRLLSKVHHHKAGSPQGHSSNNGCCLFWKHYVLWVPLFSFPTPSTYSIIGTDSGHAQCREAVSEATSIK